MYLIASYATTARSLGAAENGIVDRIVLVNPVDLVGLHSRLITCKTTEELGWYIKEKSN